MRRLRKAVASDEGFGGENLLEAMGSLREEVDEMLNVSLFVESVLPKHLVLLFCVVLCDPDIYCSYTLSWTLFESMISVWK